MFAGKALFIENKSAANSAASSPPVPARTSRMALRRYPCLLAIEQLQLFLFAGSCACSISTSPCAIACISASLASATMALASASSSESTNTSSIWSQTGRKSANSRKIGQDHYWSDGPIGKPRLDLLSTARTFCIDESRLMPNSF